MRRLLRPAQARAGLPHDLPDARCRTGRRVRIHRAVPQSDDATKSGQARPEVLIPFTTVRDFGVEPVFLCIFIGYQKPDRIWYNARAVAESVKTLTWRYMMRAEPFQATEETPLRD